MKTTLNIRDDILRRAKARAALRGQPLARYVEEGLEQRLIAEEGAHSPLGDWLRGLPKLSSEAVRELDEVLAEADFRVVDDGMWQ